MAVGETTPLLGSNGPAYTIFTPGQKLAIICTATLASVFSPFSANIYYPAMSDIRKELNLTETLVNTTITSYMIFQGISPLFVGSSSDSAGRRPIYILCFSIYAVANVALAFQREFWGLLLLRCLQSTGSSSLVNLAYAVTADVVTSSERGKYIGFASVGPIIGPSLGPVVGGIISKHLGWRWIFIFLAAAALVMLAGIVALLPETCRAVVGDGSVKPPKLIHRSLISYCTNRYKEDILSDEDSADVQREELPMPKKRVSPLDALCLLIKYPIGLVLMYNGIQFAGYYAIMSSLTFSFEDIYGFDQVQISFAYLLIGLGTLVAAFGNGFIVDWNFRRHARKAGFEPSEVKNMDPEEARSRGFCVERARLEIAIPEISTAAKIMVAYAWCMQSGKQSSLAMVLLFAFGVFSTAAYSCLNVLIVDLSRGSPATGTAANNVVRCSIAAAGTAAIMPVIHTVGIGWAFTAVAGLWMVAMPMILVVLWRKKDESVENDDS